jgi:tetratricopeptide (TPR) repeat protein
MLAIILFLIGLFTKEEAITLPLLIIIMDVFVHLTNWKKRFVLKKIYSCWIPFLIVMISGVSIRLWVFFTIDYPELVRSPYHNLLTQLYVITRYLGMFLIPSFRDLSIYHHVEVLKSISSAKVILPAMLLIAMVVFSVLMAKKVPLVAFGILWFLITLLPSSSLIPVEELMAEHRAYLPMAGLALMPGFIFFRIMKIEGFMKTGLRIIPILALFVMVLMLSLQTKLRNDMWLNEEKIWKDAVTKATNSWVPYFGLGDTYRRRLQYRKAIKYYEIAHRLNPQSVLPIVNLGMCYANIHEYGRAESYFLDALRKDPENYRAIMNLGATLFMKGNYDEARRYFELVLRIVPDNIDAMLNLGKLFSTIGNIEMAIRYYNKAMSLEPDREIRKQIGAIIDQLKRL